MAGNKNSGNYGTPANKTPPEKEAEILALLMEGKGIVQTAALAQVSKGTVQRIREENHDKVPCWKRNTVERLQATADKLVDSLNNDLDNDKLSPGSKPIAVGIFLDKIRDLSGEANQTVEHRHLHLTGSDVKTLLSPPTDNVSGTDGQNKGKTADLPDSAPHSDPSGPHIEATDVIDLDANVNDKEEGGGGS